MYLIHINTACAILYDVEETGVCLFVIQIDFTFLQYVWTGLWLSIRLAGGGGGGVFTQCPPGQFLWHGMCLLLINHCSGPKTHSPRWSTSDAPVLLTQTAHQMRVISVLTVQTTRTSGANYLIAHCTGHTFGFDISDRQTAHLSAHCRDCTWDANSLNAYCADRTSRLTAQTAFQNA